MTLIQKFEKVKEKHNQQLILLMFGARKSGSNPHSRLLNCCLLNASLFYFEYHQIFLDIYNVDLFIILHSRVPSL